MFLDLLEKFSIQTYVYLIGLTIFCTASIFGNNNVDVFDGFVMFGIGIIILSLVMMVNEDINK